MQSYMKRFKEAALKVAQIDHAQLLRFLYIDINKERSGQLVESCIEEMSTTLNELYD